MGGLLNLDGGTLNVDGGTLNLDRGTRRPRPPYNLSTAHNHPPSVIRLSYTSLLNTSLNLHFLRLV